VLLGKFTIAVDLHGVRQVPPGPRFRRGAAGPEKEDRRGGEHDTPAGGRAEFRHRPARAATSNQAERDLRPTKIQQNISGWLTSEERTRDRFRILGYLSTAAKHGRNQMTVLRQAILGRPWMPELPATA
jgi:hypothetical protein